MAVDPTDRFVYLTDHVSDRINVFQIEANGGLTPVFPGGLSVDAEPFDLIIPGWRVDGRLLMVVAPRLR